MMRIALKNPHTWIVMGVDTALIILSFWLSFWLRFETITPDQYTIFINLLAPVLVVKHTAFIYYGMQSGMWRFTGVIDLINLIKASVISFAVIVIGVSFVYYSTFTGGISRTVFVIDTFITVCLIGSFRLLIRFYFTRNIKIGGVWELIKPSRLSGEKTHGGIPALIYGANERGEILLRSLMSPLNPSHYEIAGFVDDSSVYDGVNIHGYPILGGLDKLEDTVSRLNVRELLIASQMDPEMVERINARCKAAGILCRIVPAHLDGFHEKIDATRLRGIQIEDLLSRTPVTIDYTMVADALNGKRVMITGAGGSIGSELARKLAEFSPAAMILVDIGENYLFELGRSLERFDGVNATYHCADITNSAKMERLFEKFRPQFVFHAAAHKHVPMMEMNRDEAIRNNIGGIKVVADLSERFGAERFILISTDKAVNPSNVMGATKRVCELYAQIKAQKSKTAFLTVRFGNVLGSNGSVVPIFLKQIEERGPVTVTDEEVERYFMTIPEAVLLILQAAFMGSQGELFILDMGSPVKIADLARKMIQLAGFVPGKDIEIAYTGLRPGEKLKEELSGVGEVMEPTAHPKINRVAAGLVEADAVETAINRLLLKSASDPDGAYKMMMIWLSSGKAPEEDGAANPSKLILVKGSQTG
ncbi:MAG: polysaccharide biosynthesis protein [Nitrospinae bacterium]|nr:polysaccharide biosynthesis protein [Nitrospinota bacterium]